MVKCKSLRINMFRITHTGKSVNFPVTPCSVKSLTMEENLQKGRLFHRVPCAKSREKLQEFFQSVACCSVNNTETYFNLFACYFKPCNTSVITRVPNFIL